MTATRAPDALRDPHDVPLEGVMTIMGEHTLRGQSRDGAVTVVLTVNWRDRSLLVSAWQTPMEERTDAGS